MKYIRMFFILLFVALYTASCNDGAGVIGDFPSSGGTPSVTPPGVPADEDVLQDGYPASVALYRFTDWFDAESKCVGWYAIVDVSSSSDVEFNAVHELSPGKTPEGVFAEMKFQGKTPYIVTNGGYFYNGESLSLCINDGKVESIAAQMTWPDGKEVYPVRAALGMFEDGRFEATWVYCPSDGGMKPYSYPSPLDNDESTGTFMDKMPSASYDGAVLWAPEEAIGGGPMLVLEGKNVSNDYYYKEVLDAGGTAGKSRQPRTAIASTEDGKVILLVCDGRKMNDSKGYTLAELADKLISLGAVNAVNLDGGGSSAIVGKDGKVLNRPSDSGSGTSVKMRQVPTALVISAKER